MTDTVQKILDTAKAEFLEKGYNGASMRSIAAKVGITPMAIYKHYADKEALFDAVLEPVTTMLDSLWNSTTDSLYETMTRASPDAMWKQEEGAFGRMTELVYANYDLFKILICKSAGTKHENFIHDLAEYEQKETFRFMDTLKESGHSVKEVDRVEFHLIMSAQLTAFFEIVRHDFTYEKALHYAGVIEAFFTPSWRKLLGF